LPDLVPARLGVTDGGRGPLRVGREHRCGKKNYSETSNTLHQFAPITLELERLRSFQLTPARKHVDRAVTGVGQFE